MLCNKCRGSMCFCPVTFGLALGLTSFLIVFCVYVLAVYHVGFVAPMMVMMHETAPTIHAGLVHACSHLVGGFIFGFIFALIYNLIKKLCRSCCKGKSDGNACGCNCGPSDRKPEIRDRQL
jgi:hypothetical protein